MRLVLRCGNVLDGVSPSPLGPRAILVQDGKIQAILPADSEIDGHAIDLTKGFVMPGLIDCHVHLTSDATPARQVTPHTEGPEANYGLVIKAMRNMQRSLQGGVTTVRDLGAPNDVILLLRDLERSGSIMGPRIVASGSVITTTGGHGWAHGLESDTVAEVRKSARAQLKKGVDLLKIMSSGGVFTALSRSGNCQYSVEELREAVIEAEKMGKRVATHVHSKEAIKSAVLAGIHSIEHGIFLDDECIELMLERGTYLVPTLVPHAYIQGNPDIGKIPQVFLDRIARILEPNFIGATKAIKAGVKIAAGCDSGLPFMEHGRVEGEVETLSSLGMNPYEALKCATKYAAELLQVDDKVGTLEPGKVADIMAVEGNPLLDLTTLRYPVLVLHDAKVAACDSSVATAPRTPETLLITRRTGWPTWRWCSSGA
jgi:imidazolonepropionase-like amidohydrolase